MSQGHQKERTSEQKSKNVQQFRVHTADEGEVAGRHVIEMGFKRWLGVGGLRLEFGLGVKSGGKSQ